MFENICLAWETFCIEKECAERFKWHKVIFSNKSIFSHLFHCLNNCYQVEIFGKESFENLKRGTICRFITFWNKTLKISCKYLRLFCSRPKFPLKRLKFWAKTLLGNFYLKVIRLKLFSLIHTGYIVLFNKLMLDKIAFCYGRYNV